MKSESVRGSVPLRGGVVCLAVGLAVMFIPMPTFVVYIPLFLAAFVLAIVAIAQGRATGGVTLLILTVITPGAAWLAAMALGFTLWGVGFAGAESTVAPALKEAKAKDQNPEPVGKQVTHVVEPAAPVAPPPAPSRFVGNEVGRMKEAFEMVGGNDEGALFRSKDYGIATLLHRGRVAGVGVERLDKKAITREEAAQILTTLEGGSWMAAPGFPLQEQWTNGNGLSAELQLAGRMLGITKPDLVDQAEREKKSQRLAPVEAGQSSGRPERLTEVEAPEVARKRQAAAAAKAAAEERKARVAAAREVRLVAFQLQEATNGSSGAQFAVGLRYLRGEGVETNAELARTWLEKAAAQGNDLAKAKIEELVGK